MMGQHDSQGLQDQPQHQTQPQPPPQQQSPPPPQQQSPPPPPPQQTYQQYSNNQSQQYDTQNQSQSQNQNQQQNQNQYQNLNQYHYQYQQPYPLQYEPQQFPNQFTTPHTSPKSMWITKLSLRIISSVFCIVIIGLSASNAARYDLAAIVLFGAPAGLAFCWNVAESFCLWLRGGHRGIHPGACVGLDLLIWLGWVITIIMFALLGYLSESYDWYSYYYYDNNYYDDSSYNRMINTGRAAFAFAVLALIIHFALFVIACYETNLRNRNRSYPQIIYVQAPPPMAMNPGMNHQSMAAPQGYQVPPSGYQPQTMYPPQPPQYVRPQESTTTPEGPVTTPSPVHSSNRYA